MVRETFVAKEKSSTGTPGFSSKYSYIRAISCIAIIALHTVFSSLLVYQKGLTELQVMGSRIMVNNLMWAVPCFFMVSGALLLDRRREMPYKKLFTKYIGKMLLVILIFTWIYSISDMFLNGQPGFGLALLQGIYKAFTDTSWSHMWYLYTLIGIYLMLPLYKKIIQGCTEKDIWYLLAVLFIFLSLFPLLEMFGVSFGVKIPAATIYPFWFFLGYALKGQDRGRAVPAVFFSVGTLGLILFTILRWTLPMEGMEQLFAYSSPVVILQAMGLYLLLYSIPVHKKGWLHKVLVWIDRRSFGIYLVHLIFIRWGLRFFHINPYGLGIGSPLFLALFVLGVLVLSGAVVFILQKIPGVNKLI